MSSNKNELNIFRRVGKVGAVSLGMARYHYWSVRQKATHSFSLSIFGESSIQIQLCTRGLSLSSNSIRKT